MIREIKLNRPGRVEFNGSQWDAGAEEEIPEGAQVEVLGKSNLTLKVRMID